MCGIVGYIGEYPAQPFLIEGLKRLAYRGYDSCGIATFEDGGLALRKVLGKVALLESELAEEPTKGTLGVGHTRWATHGKPSLINAHPIRVGSSLIVHNGILENYGELKERLVGRGVPLTTETDTEIIAQLIEEGIVSGSSPKESLIKALKQLEGSYAILFFSLKTPENLYLAKKDLPLIIGRGESGLFASSDTFAMAPFVKEVAHVPDRTVVLLQKGVVRAFSKTGEPVSLAFEKLLFNDMSIDKKGFKHFLLKEIFEQPRAFEATLEAYLEDRLKAFSSLIPLNGRSLEDLETVYLIGCGTAFHAAMLGKMFFQEFSGIEAVSEFASEFRFRGYVNPKSLGVLVSQSGETADTLSAMRILKDRGVPTVGIPNVPHSSLARSTASIPTYAGPEVSVASTKAFTSQVLVMYLLALWLGLKRGRLDAKTVDGYLERLKGVAAVIDRVLNLYPSIQKAATGLLGAHHLVYLGRGPFMPLALEGALKIKEIAYVYAEGLPAGEIKHGPIALIEPGVYTIALFDARDSVQRGKMLTTMEEVLSRGGEGLLVHTGFLDHPTPLPAICLPAVDLPFLQIIPATVALQLLAYAVAVLKGTDVDQPRNLAKSVTVE